MMRERMMRGRPPVPVDTRKDITVSLRLSVHENRAMRRLMQVRRSSFSGLVRDWIRLACGEEVVNGRTVPRVLPLPAPPAPRREPPHERLCEADVDPDEEYAERPPDYDEEYDEDVDAFIRECL